MKNQSIEYAAFPLSYQTFNRERFFVLGKNMMPIEPEPGDSIPAYVVDGIDRQDAATLEAIAEYARARREYLDALESRELAKDDLADDGEEVVDIEDSDGGTVVIKKVPCGKECDGCPHGPYKYVVQRDGDSLNWDYKGPAATAD
jgi:hypothetical protein